MYVLLEVRSPLGRILTSWSLLRSLRGVARIGGSPPTVCLHRLALCKATSAGCECLPSPLHTLLRTLITVLCLNLLSTCCAGTKVSLECDTLETSLGSSNCSNKALLIWAGPRVVAGCLGCGCLGTLFVLRVTRALVKTGLDPSSWEDPEGSLPECILEETDSFESWSGTELWSDEASAVLLVSGRSASGVHRLVIPLHGVGRPGLPYSTVSATRPDRGVWSTPLVEEAAKNTQICQKLTAMKLWTHTAEWTHRIWLKESCHP